MMTFRPRRWAISTVRSPETSSTRMIRSTRGCGMSAYVRSSVSAALYAGMTTTTRLPTSSSAVPSDPAGPDMAERVPAQVIAPSGPRWACGWQAIASRLGHRGNHVPRQWRLHNRTAAPRRGGSAARPWRQNVERPAVLPLSKAIRHEHVGNRREGEPCAEAPHLGVDHEQCEDGPPGGHRSARIEAQVAGVRLGRIERLDRDVRSLAHDAMGVVEARQRVPVGDEDRIAWQIPEDLGDHVLPGMVVAEVVGPPVANPNQ